MDTVLFDWPYVGLIVAVVALAVLVCAPRAHDAPSRWRDPAFVLPLVLPMYLLHQFEEHGIDALGHHYAFLASLCGTLGIVPCPADPDFIFAVNMGGVAIALALAVACRRRAPLVAACAWGIPIVNAVTHIASTVVTQRYNPGVVTSVVLFVPLAVVMLRALRPSRWQLVRIVATGVLVHVLLVGSLLLHARGLIPHWALLAINVANGFLPLLMAR